MCKKQSYIVNAAIVVAVVTMMLFFPVLGTAGMLDPTAAPGSTMKTLDQIPPTWSTKIPGAERFVVLADFNNEAVLDKETGLVWEKAPSTQRESWYTAVDKCAEKEVGGRQGWLLPSINQLASLADTSVAGSPKLPAGHPFTGVQSAQYWSATSVPYDASAAWCVQFDFGKPNQPGKINNFYWWCVRGGSGPSAYGAY